MTNQQKKTKFRQSSEWKKFRKEMYKRSNGIDCVTEKPLRKGWQLHHLDMRVEKYSELNPEKFICINRSTHEFIHWLFRYKNWKQCLYNLADIMSKMCYYNDEVQKR